MWNTEVNSSMTNDVMEIIEKEVKKKLKAMDELGEDFEEDFGEAIEDLAAANPYFKKDFQKPKRRKEIIEQIVGEIT